MAPFKALYGRACRTLVCWNEVKERKLTGPELIQYTIEAVQVIKTDFEPLKVVKKIYVDRRRKPLEFQVGDHVFLKVSPMRGVSRFGKKGKLSP